jgi:NAD(P)-dependent dehydrogenase (short-subunit alcohol dehydrogenase family)
MLLEGKAAVVYGAGAVGGAVARAFARDGARVFLASRSRRGMEAIANVAASGGRLSTAVVDARDTNAVERHLAEAVADAGGIDISFNAIGLGGAQGSALVDMAPDAFLSPIRPSTQITAEVANLTAGELAD